jgi:hypothetical protein
VKFYLFNILFLSFFCDLHAQDDEYINYKLIQAKHSYTIDFSVPVSIANKPFKGVMQGFLRGSVSYQYSLKNKINFGLGFNYTYFQVNRFKMTPNIVGGMHILNSFAKIGYESFFNERIGYDIGIKSGFSNIIFHSDALQTDKKFNTHFFEPYTSFVLTADDKSSFKWTLTYNFLLLGFQPNFIGDLTSGEHSEKELNRITRYLTFGFSFTHYFKQWE